MFLAKKRPAFRDFLPVALHQGQLLEVAAYVPDTRATVAASRRQLPAVVVESEIQNFVVVSQ